MGFEKWFPTLFLKIVLKKLLVIVYNGVGYTYMYYYHYFDLCKIKLSNPNFSKFYPNPNIPLSADSISRIKRDSWYTDISISNLQIACRLSLALSCIMPYMFVSLYSLYTSLFMDSIRNFKSWVSSWAYLFSFVYHKFQYLYYLVLFHSILSLEIRFIELSCRMFGFISAYESL